MRKRSKHTRAASMLWGSLLVALILFSLGWVYRANWITGSLEVETAQTGSIDHYVTVKAIFANEEYVIQSPASGKVELLGKEGQRFRLGETVAQIHPEGAAPGSNTHRQTVQVSMPKGGLFFQKVDGLESVLTPESLVNMDLARILEQQENSETPKDIVQAGAPLGKVVNNLSPTVAFVEAEPSKDLSVGKTIKFKLDDQIRTGKILRVSDNPKGIVVRFNQYLEGTVNNRIQNVQWITKPSETGIVIPKSALFTKGEELGVYVVQEGILQFRKVNVIDENDSLVCVNNLPQGIPIVKNPRPGIEGLTANVKIPS